MCGDLCFLTPVRLFRLSSRTFTVRKNALLAKTWRSTSRKYFLHGGERSKKGCHGRNNIIQITKSGIIQRGSLLSLVRGSLQHERDFHQSVVILKLRQHLQQEDNGSVHMRCKTSRSVNLIYWNTPDALKGTRREKKRSRRVEFDCIATIIKKKHYVFSHLPVEHGTDKLMDEEANCCPGGAAFTFDWTTSQQANWRNSESLCFEPALCYDSRFSKAHGNN